MYRLISLWLLALLLASCSAYNKTVETPDNENLATISLQLTTHLGDQQQFIDGDEIRFFLSIEQDAYIYMYYVDAAKNITQILPNENQQSNFYVAGYFMAVPDNENHYRFIISKPFGHEFIWVFASDQAIAIKQSPASIESIKQLIKKSSDKAYGEYVLNIVTARQ